jgi:hypothetical protein
VARGESAHDLFDLSSDIGEATNRAGERAELVEQLDALIELFLRDTGALLPKPNPDYDSAAA